MPDPLRADATTAARELVRRYGILPAELEPLIRHVTDETVQSLAARGLLVTDEIQAVLDAVAVWPRDEPLWAGAKAAFDAYLATRGPA